MDDVRFTSNPPLVIDIRVLPLQRPCFLLSSIYIHTRKFWVAMEGDGYGSFQQVGTTEEEDGVPFGEEPPKRPNINPCLWVFHLIEAFNVVVACLLAMTQLLPFFFVRAQDWSHKVRSVALTTNELNTNESIPKAGLVLDDIENIHINLLCPSGGYRIQHSHPDHSGISGPPKLHEPWFPLFVRWYYQRARSKQ